MCSLCVSVLLIVSVYVQIDFCVQICVYFSVCQSNRSSQNPLVRVLSITCSTLLIINKPVKVALSLTLSLFHTQHMYKCVH